ncbi:MAG: Holliday junction branch migration protein RuvA [Candidatus Anammoxibacter sp.]
MYDYIRGEIISKSPTHLVIESAGIGYFVNIPLSTFDTIPNKGDVKVFTQLFIRDELFSLYGFATIDERSIFKLLISISGIGPKIALAILSGSPLDELKSAIVNDDVKFLSKIKGIGKKTAERIVLELKESIKNVSIVPVTKEKAEKDQMIDDAVKALISLGHIQSTAEIAVNRAVETFKFGKYNIGDFIRQALKNTGS